MDKKTINKKFKELAKIKMEEEELKSKREAIEDELKTYMTAEELETLIGDEHKATYISVSSNRIDTKLLKKEMPLVAAKYTKASTSMRFTFA